MKFWQTLATEIAANHRVVLLYVIESIGSSPGRQGFKMWVSDSGKLHGSIGGGIMEHKLVEWCKKELLAADFQPFIKRQIHQGNIKKEKSGMICSGEQTVAFYPLQQQELPTIQAMIDGVGGKCIRFNQEGITLIPFSKIADRYQLTWKNEQEWLLIENPNFYPQLHIIGGGHVGLALSKLANQLGFQVSVYDDRKGLNTVAVNQEAKFCEVADYEQIDQYILQGKYQYVVLMSFGYRTDKVILKRLIDKEFEYLGMMGSKKKVAVLFQELIAEGSSEHVIAKAHAPIGLQINSKTPEEIAISILAELIQVKNREE